MVFPSLKHSEPHRQVESLFFPDKVLSEDFHPKAPADLQGLFTLLSLPHFHLLSYIHGQLVNSLSTILNSNTLSIFLYLDNPTAEIK